MRRVVRDFLPYVVVGAVCGSGAGDPLERLELVVDCELSRVELEAARSASVAAKLRMKPEIVTHELEGASPVLGIRDGARVEIT
jgi:hypothetical protein